MFSVPLAGLQRSEGLQSLVHPSKIPESNVIIISTRHQAGSRGVQAKSRHLRKQFKTKRQLMSLYNSESKPLLITSYNTRNL